MIPAGLRDTVAQWLASGHTAQAIAARLARTGAHVSEADIYDLASPLRRQASPHMDADPGETPADKSKALCSIARLAFNRHLPNVRFHYRTRPVFDALTGEIIDYELLLDKEGNPIRLEDEEVRRVYLEAGRQQREIALAVSAIRAAGQVVAALPDEDAPLDSSASAYTVALPVRRMPE